MPSAAAATVWEEIVVSAPLGIIPKDSFTTTMTPASVSLAQYSQLRLEFKYQNVGMGVTDLKYTWAGLTQDGWDVGGSTQFKTLPVADDAAIHEETVDFSVDANVRVRLWLSHGAADQANFGTVEKHPTHVAITDFKLYGKKDDGAPAVPAAPTLVSPANGGTIGYATTQDHSAVLMFTKAADVALTQIRISGDLQTVGSGTVASRTLNGGSYGSNQTLTYFASPSSTYNWVPGATYTWQVRASFSNIPYDAAEGWGPWSETRTFTVAGIPNTPQPPLAPTLVSPANGADVDTTTPTLEWNASAGADSYMMQLATDADFDGMVSSTGTALTSRSFADFPLTIDTTYYWRVAAINDVGQGDWSEIQTFTVVEPQPPVAPILVSPADEADVYTHYPQLVWQYMSNVDEYTIELAEDDEFTDVVWWATHVPGASTDDHFHTITGFPFEDDMTYYWRVKASNEHGESDWSEVYSFTVRAELEDEDDDTPGQGQTGNEGESVTTTTTTTTTTVTTTQFIPDWAYYAVAGAQDEQADETETSSDETSAGDDEEEVEEDAPFLILGWWWLAVITVVGTGAYLLFKTPDQE